MNLTETQRQAIAHTKGNLQLIACAGSGKTEVVARFVSNLLNPATEPQVAPANIIAFTFTEKAAAELKERIVTRCREENGNLPGLAELYVGTIHAFCLDLLKTEVARFLKYEVLNEVQQALFVDRHSRKSGLTTATDLTGILLRSVRNSAGPITQALSEAGIPFVIGGMNNLFSTREAEAARQLFYFIRDRVDANGLVEAWLAADLGVSRTAVARAVAGARETKESLGESDEKRWSFYSLQRQFLSFLADLELREDSIPDGRGEVVFYNLGKFSQLISDFETIHCKGHNGLCNGAVLRWCFRSAGQYPHRCPECLPGR